MLQVAICDDNLPITTEIEALLLYISKRDAIPMDIQVFFDGDSLWQEMNSGRTFDIVYMDIEMNRLNGVDAGRLIRSHNLPTILIYISAYDTYYQQLFEVESFRFIHKPISRPLFEKYFKEAYEKLHTTFQFYSFRFRQKYTKVLISNILYFESHGRHVIVHTTTSKEYYIDKLDVIETRLAEQNIEFLRIHQSYLVNPYHIYKVASTYVELDTHLRLTISPKFQPDLQKQYLNILERF